MKQPKFKYEIVNPVDWKDKPGFGFVAAGHVWKRCKTLESAQKSLKLWPNCVIREISKCEIK